jgi:outer membrane protein assembly factor BamA
MVGIQAQWGYFETSNFKTGGELIKKQIIGTQPYFTSGLGFVATWDNRDNFFYPTKGEFYKLAVLVNSKIFASDLSFTRLTIDMRKYYPIVGAHLMSLQVLGDITWGDVPFQAMPTMGGNDVLRGYYKGRYRDKNLLAIQLEYRFPIYKWLKGSLFGSAGDVSDEIEDIIIREFKISYGGGLRARVNPANVHLRFDIGLTPERKPSYYFTASEAF